MKKLHFQPIKDKADEIIRAVISTEEVSKCEKELFALRLVCDELIVNVVSYAYPKNEDGYLDVEIEKTSQEITLRFKDGGKPFNPLERKMPDINAPLEERQIGGLGIFLTIKQMDSVNYEYTNGENVLTVKKTISSN
ncbi:MAG: ATP-binding protein [Bacteroidales bacterium]|nr:ATP-binding protein [Bacteroidales bacterium]